MPCGACGCACSEAPREEPEAPLLMDTETGPGHITVAPPDGQVDEPTDAETDKAHMISFCIARGLVGLMCLYLFDFMRRTIRAADYGDNFAYTAISVGVSAALAGMLLREFCVAGPRNSS